MATLTKEGDDDATDLLDEGGGDGFEWELALDRSVAQKDAVAALVEATDEVAFTESCLTFSKLFNMPQHNGRYERERQVY